MPSTCLVGALLEIFIGEAIAEVIISVHSPSRTCDLKIAKAQAQTCTHTYALLQLFVSHI